MLQSKCERRVPGTVSQPQQIQSQVHNLIRDRGIPFGHPSLPPWHQRRSFPSSCTFYFYAPLLKPVRHLPVTPPQISQTCDQLGTWEDARALANVTTTQLTLDEKVGILIGKGQFGSRCVGDTNPVSRLSIPNLCMNDGPAG